MTPDPQVDEIRHRWKGNVSTFGVSNALKVQFAEHDISRLLTVLEDKETQIQRLIEQVTGLQAEAAIYGGANQRLHADLAEARAALHAFKAPDNVPSTPPARSERVWKEGHRYYRIDSTGAVSELVPVASSPHQGAEPTGVE